MIKRVLPPKSEAPRTVRRRNHREPVPSGISHHLRRGLHLLGRIPWALPAAGLLVAIGVGVHHFLTQSPYFQIEEITLAGLERLPGEAVYHAMENHAFVMEGVSLFLADEALLRESIVRIAAVEEVEVRKVWPNRLEIALHEKVPMGILVSDSGSQVFDDEGLLFGEALPRDFRRGELSTLTGVGAEKLLEGKRLPPRAMEYFSRYQRVFSRASPETLAKIAEFHWDDDQGLTLWGHDGSRFHCGFRGPDEVGPLIETILRRREDSSPGQAVIASLVSENTVAISDAPEPRGVPLREFAQHRR